MNHYSSCLILLLVAFVPHYTYTESLPVSSKAYKFWNRQAPPSSPEVRPSSCGICGIGGPDVDVYYWPSPDANTSCLSIIGSKANPPLAGATIKNGLTYWGSGGIPTMIYTSINGVTFKMPLVDPYSSCSYSGAPTPDNLIGQTLGGGFRLMRARANPMTIPMRPRAPINESLGMPVGNHSFPAGNSSSIETTVIYQGYTFTSPSIYVNFYSLSATDSCGLLGGGPNGIIPSTLIAFPPGELSTLAMPLNEWEHGLQPGLTSYEAPYNFADLPCPPYNTMCAQWYIPEPGEPYRPIIAFPSRLQSVDPLWQDCTLGLFTGLDPPTALHPATVLAPHVTPAGDPKSKQVEAKPSPTPETIPANTANPAAAANAGTAQLVPAAKSTAASDPTIDDPANTNGETSSQLPAAPGPIADGSKADPIGEESGQVVPSVKDLGTPTSLNPSKEPVVGNKVPALLFVPPRPSNTFKDGQSMTINRQVIQQLSQGISIAGTTLTPGASPITVSGTPIIYGPSVLVVGTSTVSLASDSDLPEPTTTTIAGKAFTIEQNTVRIAGTILTPGSSAMTVSGTPIYLGSSSLVIGTSTVPVGYQTSNPLITTVAGHVITAAPNVVVIAGTTLRPGGSHVTLDGTVVSLDTAGQLVVGSKTVPLASKSAGLSGLILGGFADESPSEVSDLFVTTIGGQAITTAPTAVAFAGTTLTPGALGKLINGTLVSLNTAGQLVINSKTIPFESYNADLGGLITGPFGSNPPSPNSSNGTSAVANNSIKDFQGKAEALESYSLWKHAMVSVIAIFVSMSM